MTTLSSLVSLANTLICQSLEEDCEELRPTFHQVIFTGLIGFGLWAACYWRKKTVTPLSLQPEVHPPPIEDGQRNHFLKRIPEAAWKEIHEQIPEEPIHEEVLKAFQTGNWQNPVFYKNNWIYLAFGAYLARKLDLDQMCTLFLFQECQKQKGFQQFQLYPSYKKINAAALIALAKVTHKYLSREQFQNLIDEMALFPIEKTYFFQIEPHLDPLLERVTQTEETKYNLGLFIMNDETDHPELSLFRFQMILPPHFAYQVHRAKFGENAVHPTPILGFNHNENLSNPTSRVVSIPGFDLLPKKVHELACAPLSLYHHDIGYHHAIESANPHRGAWILLASFLKKLHHRQAVGICLDREFYNYLFFPLQDRSDDFWIALALLSCRCSELNENVFIDLVAVFFRSYGKILETEYGIYLLSIESALKQIESTHFIHQFLTKLSQKLSQWPA